MYINEYFFRFSYRIDYGCLEVVLKKLSNQKKKKKLIIQ